VYPNPTDGHHLNIKGTMPIRLRIFDVIGNELTSFDYDAHTGQVTLNGFNAGVYSVKIIGPDAIVYKKIIVN
ncbi:MAG TPA: T9SS type A sorting domain-containing protein, partial [Cytophagales bacterium]|nr:T9SS type A sorting domain-containing protein [Cytophagales bacterium]